jgi:hypothetical protein
LSSVRPEDNIKTDPSEYILMWINWDCLALTVGEPPGTAIRYKYRFIQKEA